jgi:hypothetical protein
VQPDFVELLGLGQSLTPSRTNGGAVHVELCWTHSLKATVFKPLPLNIKRCRRLPSKKSSYHNG